MARIVMKFGGTSMAGTERIRTVAKLVAREVAQGNEVAVVVSAMAGETDRLVNFRSEEHTSELQSLMRISYAVFCLKKKQIRQRNTAINNDITSLHTTITTVSNNKITKKLTK